jgi:polysaccharide biosynthesis transport protein
MANKTAGEPGNDFLIKENYTFKDYINMSLNNIYLMVIIIAICGVIGFIYAFYQPDTYKSTTSMKLLPPKGSILDSPLMGEMNSFANDRFIANEIEIMKSYTIRENVAYTLKKSFQAGAKDSFYLILKEDIRNPKRFVFFNSNKDVSFNKLSEVPYRPDTLLRNNDIAALLSKTISIDQKRGLDIVEISAESPSPYEAAIMANSYAQAYINLNLMMNRTKVSVTRKFLEQQRKEKYNDLKRAEDTLKIFQQSRGIVELSEQSKQLVNQMGEYDAQKIGKEMEVAMYEKSIAELKTQLVNQEPKIADALESSKLEAYLKEVQAQLARLEVNKDYASTNARNDEERKRITDKYNSEIKELKKQETERINALKNLVTSKSAIEDASKLGLEVIEDQIKLQAARESLNGLKSVVKTYESKFNLLPKNIIEFAQLQRQSSAYEKLYQMVEEKYQEALVNEQSTIGNVQLVDIARKPAGPVGPNRQFITVIGFFLGLLISFGIVVAKNQMANTVKSPEDIQRLNIPLLGWLPLWYKMKNGDESASAMIAAKDPLSKSAEAFRAIRTRIHFSRNKKEKIVTLLITSSTSGEGKSTTAVNLAEIFAQADKKTLLVDCDLRKSNIHKVFSIDKIPGLVDHLSALVDYEKIIVFSGMKNLYLVTAGSHSQNPAELLNSGEMERFVEKVKSEFDFVIFDSPPILAVTDSEILSRITDASVLIAGANEANREMLKKATQLLKDEDNSFLGVILNKFKFNIGYGYYYKNYYYYYTDKKKNRFSPFSRLFGKNNNLN